MNQTILEHTQLVHKAARTGLRCCDAITKYCASSIGELQVIRDIFLRSVRIDLYIDGTVTVV